MELKVHILKGELVDECSLPDFSASEGELVDECLSLDISALDPFEGC